MSTSKKDKPATHRRKDGKLALNILPKDTFEPNPDGTPWYARTFRITTVRIISQAFFFGLFVFFIWATWFSRLEGYPVSWFLEADPLVGIATALSTKTVYRWLYRGLFVLVLTLVLVLVLALLPTSVVRRAPGGRRGRGIDLNDGLMRGRCRVGPSNIDATLFGIRPPTEIQFSVCFRHICCFLRGVLHACELFPRQPLHQLSL